MTAAITVGFANLPAPAGTSYRRTADGGLTVSVAVPAKMRRTSKPSST